MFGAPRINIEYQQPYILNSFTLITSAHGHRVQECIQACLEQKSEAHHPMTFTHTHLQLWRHTGRTSKLCTKRTWARNQNETVCDHWAFVSHFQTLLWHVQSFCMTNMAATLQNKIHVSSQCEQNKYFWLAQRSGNVSRNYPNLPERPILLKA